MQSVSIRLAAGLALAVCASASVAADAPSTKPSQATEARAQSGMRAYVDPETNTLVDRPVTPEQKAVAEQTEAAFSQSTDGLEQVVHADGSVSMDLEGRFELATTATRAANGSLAVGCVDAAHAASGAHAHDGEGKVVPAAAQRDDR